MSRNHEVTSVQYLLDEHGELREPGWSRHMVQQYDRSMIKAPKWRIKEWDYYLILSDRFGVAFTISDDGYIGLQSASFLCFDDTPWEHTETVVRFFDPDFFYRSPLPVPFLTINTFVALTVCFFLTVLQGRAFLHLSETN